MTEPNDLSSAMLRARFAASLGEGAHPSRWLAAFADVPREHFVPSFYRQDGQGRWYEVSEGDPGYLKAVYSDTALTTQLDADGVPTSSSSEPGLMLAMLDALDAEPGHRLFELGLGTGYNAALASSLLGSDNVVSVDVDPDLVRRARQHLDKGCYRPHVFTGDGAEGCPDRAPYDRIIATAALRRIPHALLTQARPGAVIVAPIGFGLARFVVAAAGEATGRFLPTPAYFMPRRHPAKAPDFAAVETEAGTVTSVPMTDVLDRLKFPLSLALPGYRSCSWRDDEGAVTGVALWTEDGSTATLHASGRARQVGPRHLWDAVEELVTVFPESVAPAREDFGLTVTSAGQQVWYGEADGPSWAL
ncbi:methyltransferase domain-containing protein [Streptomyces sp. NBC_00209]|uniref:methyltransferase domain-containing protein n=1 Tax=Streptomyces sp. NBC_00209 TaxID=2975682 RepID=UPI00325010AD